MYAAGRPVLAALELAVQTLQWAGQAGPHDGVVARQLARLAGITAGSRVLDLCAGLGGPARFVATRRHCRVIALEPHTGEVLAMVGGRVNGTYRAPFVVDTGGEVISISQSTAGVIQPEPTFRRIPLKVYGTSGWDKDAFLMPNVDLEFSTIRFSRIPVVVLNLQAPSALLGFQLGGIVGHKFLAQYRVTMDLAQSELRLQKF
mgnify:CR=1 FL=1